MAANKTHIKGIMKERESKGKEKAQETQRAYQAPELKKHGKLKNKATQVSTYTYTYTYIT